LTTLNDRLARRHVLTPEEVAAVEAETAQRRKLKRVRGIYNGVVVVMLLPAATLTGGLAAFDHARLGGAAFMAWLTAAVLSRPLTAWIAAPRTRDDDDEDLEV
jgi:hypothetical protein